MQNEKKKNYWFSVMKIQREFIGSHNWEGQMELVSCMSVFGALWSHQCPLRASNICFSL